MYMPTKQLIQQKLQPINYLAAVNPWNVYIDKKKQIFFLYISYQTNEYLNLNANFTFFIISTQLKCHILLHFEIKWKTSSAKHLTRLILIDTNVALQPDQYNYLCIVFFFSPFFFVIKKWNDEYTQMRCLIETIEKLVGVCELWRSRILIENEAERNLDPKYSEHEIPHKHQTC